MLETNDRKVTRSKKLKKLFFIFIAVLVSLIIFKFFIRVTYVYNLKTKLPIVNAKVLIKHNKFWTGCVNDKYYKTNFLGVIFDVGLNNSCTTLVRKEGYIINGINKSSSLINTISLQRSVNKPLKYYVEPVFEKDRVDFLGALKSSLVFGDNTDASSDSGRIMPVFSELVDDADFDMILESIESIGPNISGGEKAKIRFTGAGGIQKINDEVLSSSIDQPFASLNLIKAPGGEYASEMVIDDYKQYVIRLRDGKTYIKVIPSIDREYLNFQVTTFDDSLLPKDKDVVEIKSVEKEMKIYPSDGKILGDMDISLSGQGFEPYSQINFYVQETDTRWSRYVEVDGSWNTYFCELIGGSSCSVSPTTASTRTLLVSENNNNQKKFIFSIDKNLKNRQIYFHGLVINLPASLFVLSRDINSISLTDGSNDRKHLYSIYSKKQSYNDYRFSIRRSIINDSSLPAGIFKINLPEKSDIDIYSFYDSELKRSFELIGRDESVEGLDLEYLLSSISNAQIQQ